MSAQAIPEFDAAEHSLVARLLHERYGRAVETEDADTELALAPPSPALTSCPTLYWCERVAHFVVAKVGGGRFHAEFFYDDGRQFGTGIEHFDDLRRCVLTLLQVQADEERERRRGGAPQ